MRIQSLSRGGEVRHSLSYVTTVKRQPSEGMFTQPPPHRKRTALKRLKQYAFTQTYKSCNVHTRPVVNVPLSAFPFVSDQTSLWNSIHQSIWKGLHFDVWKYSRCTLGNRNTMRNCSASQSRSSVSNFARVCVGFLQVHWKFIYTYLHIPVIGWQPVKCVPRLSTKAVISPK